jgi:hypothetical protein
VDRAFRVARDHGGLVVGVKDGVIVVEPNTSDLEAAWAPLTITPAQEQAEAKAKAEAEAERQAAERQAALEEPAGEPVSFAAWFREAKAAALGVEIER